MSNMHEPCTCCSPLDFWETADTAKKEGNTQRKLEVFKKVLYPEWSREISKSNLEQLRDKFVHKSSGCLPSQNIRWYSRLEREMKYTLYCQLHSSHKSYSYHANYTRDFHAA
jgi:hypothetical protein